MAVEADWVSVTSTESVVKPDQHHAPTVVIDLTAGAADWGAVEPADLAAYPALMFARDQKGLERAAIGRVAVATNWDVAGSVDLAAYLARLFARFLGIEGPKWAWTRRTVAAALVVDVAPEGEITSIEGGMEQSDLHENFALQGRTPDGLTMKVMSLELRVKPLERLANPLHALRFRLSVQLDMSVVFVLSDAARLLVCAALFGTPNNKSNKENIHS